MSVHNEEMTASEFLAWYKENEADIRAARAELQCDTRDDIIALVREDVQYGLTINEAGDGAMQFYVARYDEFPYHTPGNIRETLLSIGWVPPADRKEGVE